MQQFGLHASFAFLTSGTTFASMDRVVAGLEKIESVVQTTAEAIAGAGLGAKLDRALGATKVPQAMSGQMEKLGRATQAVATELDPLKKELRALKAEARNIDFGDLTDADQFSDARRQIEAYVGSLQKMEREIKGNSTAERELAANLKTTAKAAQGRLDIAEEQRKAMVASDRLGKAQSVQGAGKAILKELKKPQELAGEISKGLGNIQKLAGDIGGGGITELRGEILGLSVDFARTPGEVTAVFESLAGAGRDFTKLGDRIEEAKQILLDTTALDVTSEAATNLGIALGSTFKDKLQEVDPVTGKLTTSVSKLNDMNRRFASTVNVLTDNLPDVAISAEGVIPTLNSLLKSIGSAENFEPSKILAFGAALNAIGTEAELSGSFVNRMTTAISGAKKSGGGVAAYSKAIGMEADEFESLLNTDKLEVLRRVVLAYKNLEGGEIEKGQFFSKLGVGADQDKKIIQGLAANIGVLNDAITQSATAYAQGTSVQDEFNRVTLTSVFQTERAKKALDTLKLTLGFAVNEVLLPFVKAFGDVATAVLHISNKFPVLSKIIGVAAYGFGLLGAVVGTAAVALFGFQQAAAAANVATITMSRGLLPLTGFFDAALKASVATNPLVGALAEIKNVSAAARSPMSLLTLQIRTLGAASLSFALSPLGLTLIGLTALVTILEKATPGVSLLGMAIGTLGAPFSFAFGILKGFTGALLDLVGGTTGKTFQAISTPFQVVGEAIDTAMKILANFEGKGEEVGKNLAKFITAPITAAGNKIKQLWDATLGGITNRLSGFAAFARLIGQMLTGALAQNSPGPTWLIAFFWDKTINFIQGGLTGLVNFAKGIGHGLVMLLNHNAADTVGGAWHSNMEGAKDALSSFLNKASSVGSQLKNTLTSAFDSIKSSSQSMFTSMMDNISLVITGITGFITSLTKIPSFLANAIGGLRTGALPAAPEFSPEQVQTYGQREILARKSMSVESLPALYNAGIGKKEAAPDSDVAKALSVIKEQNMQLVSAVYDKNTQFGGIALKSQDPNMNPQLILRPAKPKSIDTDITRTQVGDEAYAGTKDQIEALLKELNEVYGKKVDISGWSLGGNVAQRVLADFPDLVNSITTFAAPGIDQETADKYKTRTAQMQAEGKAIPQVVEFVNKDDLATAAGQAFIPGNINLLTSAATEEERKANRKKGPITGQAHFDPFFYNQDAQIQDPSKTFKAQSITAEQLASPLYNLDMGKPRALIEAIRPHIADILAFAENAATQAAMAIVTIQGDWTNSIAAIQTAWTGFSNKFQSIMQGVVSFAQGISNSLVMLLNHGSADAVGDAWESNTEKSKSVLSSFLDFAWQATKFLVTGQIFGLIANFTGGLTTAIIVGAVSTFSAVKRELQLVGVVFDESLDKEGRNAARRQAFLEPLQGIWHGITSAVGAASRAFGAATDAIHKLTNQVGQNIDFFGALALLGSILAQTFAGLILPGTELAVIFAGLPNAIARILPLATAASIATGAFGQLEDVVLGIPMILESLTVGISEFLGVKPPLGLLNFFDQLDSYAQNVRATLADFNKNILHPLIDGLLNFVLIGTIFKPTGLLFLQAPPLFQGIIDALRSPEFKAISGFLGELFAPVAPALSGVIGLFLYLQSAIISLPLHILAEVSLRIQQAAQAAAEFAGAVIPEFTVPDVDLTPLQQAGAAVKGVAQAVQATITQTVPSLAQKGLEKVGQFLSRWILKLPFGEQLLTAITIGFNYFKTNVVPVIRLVGSVVGAAMYKWGELMVKAFPVQSFQDVLLLLPRMVMVAGKGLMQAAFYIFKGFFKFLPFLNPAYVIKQYFKYEKDLVPLLTPFDAFAAQANKILSSAFFGDISKQAEKLTGPMGARLQGIANRVDSLNVKVKRLIDFVSPALVKLREKVGLVDFAKQMGVGAAMKGPIPTLIKNLAIVGLRLQYIGGFAVAWSALYIALKSVDEGLLKAIGSVTAFTVYGKRISIVSGILRGLQLIVVPTTDALTALFHASYKGAVGFSYILDHLGKRIVPTTLTNINGMTQGLYEFNLGFARIAAPMWAVRTTQALNLVIKAFDFLLDTVGFVANGIRRVVGMSTIGLAGLFLAEVKLTLVGWRWFLEQVIVVTQAVGDRISLILGRLGVYVSSALSMEGKAILGLLNEDIGVPVARFISRIQGLAMQGLKALGGLALAGVGLVAGGIKNVVMGAISGLGYLFNQSLRLADALLHPVRTIHQLQSAIIDLGLKIAGFAGGILPVTRFIPNVIGMIRELTSASGSAAAGAGTAGAATQAALDGAATAAKATSSAFSPLLGSVLALTALIHKAIAALEYPIETLSNWLNTINKLIFAPIKLPFADVIGGLAGTVLNFARKVLPFAILGMTAFAIILKGPIKGIKSVAEAIFSVVGAVTALIKTISRLGSNPFAQITGKKAALAIGSMTGLSNEQEQASTKADIKAAQAAVTFRKLAEAEIQKERKRTHALYIKASKSESVTERQQYEGFVETVKKKHELRLFGKFGPVIRKWETETTQLTDKGKVAQEKAIAQNVLGKDPMTAMAQVTGLFDAVKATGANAEISINDLRKIATEKEGAALRSLVDDFDTLFAAQREMQQMEVKQMDVGALKVLSIQGGNVIGEAPTKQVETTVQGLKKLDNFMDIEVGLNRFRDIKEVADLIKQLGGEAAKTSAKFKDLSTEQLTQLAKAFEVEDLPQAPTGKKSSKLYQDFGIEEIERQLMALRIMADKKISDRDAPANERYKLYGRVGVTSHRNMAEEALTYAELEKLIEPVKGKQAGFVDVKKLEEAIEASRLTLKDYKGLEQVPESTNMGIVPTAIQDELTQALDLGGEAFASSKHRIIKEILEHQRNKIVEQMGDISQIVEETQTNTVEDLDHVAQKFKKRTLLERIKGSLTQLGQTIIGKVKGGVGAIQQTDFMQGRAAEKAAQEQEDLAAARQPLIARTATKLGVTPGQDLELLSRLQPGKNTAQAALQVMRPGKVPVGQIQYQGRTISEIANAFKGVKTQNLQNVARKLGIETDLEAIAASTNIEYQHLLEQIQEGINGLAKSADKAIIKFVDGLTKIDTQAAFNPSLVAGIGTDANKAYKAGIRDLARSFQGMKKPEQVLNALRTKGPGLKEGNFKGTYFEYLKQAIKEQYNETDIGAVEKLVLRAVTPATEIGSEQQLFDLLRQGQMLDINPGQQYANLLKKYRQDIDDVMHARVKFQDKTPLANALRDYLTRRGELTQDAFDTLLQKLGKKNDIQDVLEQLGGVGYIKEVESPKAIENYFGFMPDLSIAQDAAFGAKQAILQGRFESPEIQKAKDAGKITDAEIQALIEKIAHTGGFDIARLFDPSIDGSQMKLARDLRVRKVQELLANKGKNLKYLETDYDADVIAKFYSGKFHEILEDDLDEIAIALGYVNDQKQGFISKMEQELSTTELLKPIKAPKNIFQKAFAGLGQVARNLLGITTIEQGLKYSQSLNSTLGTLNTKHQTIAKQQEEQAKKEGELFKSQREARQNAFKRALMAAKMTEADVKGKLTPDLQNTLNKYINTGKLMAMASQDVKKKVAAGFGKNFSVNYLEKARKALAEHEVVKVDNLGRKTVNKVNLATPFADLINTLPGPGKLDNTQVEQIKQITGVLKKFGLDIEQRFEGKDIVEKFRKFRMDLHPSTVNDQLQTLLREGTWEREIKFDRGQVSGKSLGADPDAQELARALGINVGQFKRIGQGKFELTQMQEIEMQLTEYFTNLHKGFTDFTSKFRNRVEGIKFLGIGQNLFVPLFKRVDALMTSVSAGAKAMQSAFTRMPIVRQTIAAKAKQQADRAKSLQTLLDRPEFAGRADTFGANYEDRIKSLLVHKKLDLPEHLIDNALRAVLNPDPKGIKAGLFAATQGMENREILTKVLGEALGNTLKITTEETKKLLEPGALSTKAIQPFAAYFAREIPDLMLQLGRLGVRASKAIFNDLVKAVGAPVNAFLGKASNRAAQTAARMVNSLRTFFPDADKGIGKYVTKLEDLLLATGKGVEGYFQRRVAAIAVQKSVIGRTVKALFSSFSLIVTAFTTVTGLIKKAANKLMPMVRAMDWLDVLTLGWKNFLFKVGSGVKQAMGRLTTKVQSALLPKPKKPPAPGMAPDASTVPRGVLVVPPPGTGLPAPPPKQSIKEKALSQVASIKQRVKAAVRTPTPPAPQTPSNVFIAPPAGGGGLPTAPVTPPPPRPSVATRIFNALGNTMQEIADAIDIPAIKEIKTRRMVKVSTAERTLPPAQVPGAPPLPSPYLLGDVWVPLEQNTRTTWNRIGVWLSENTKATATRLSMYLGDTPRRVSSAWEKARGVIFNGWGNWVQKAKAVSTFIVEALNHRASETTSAAWDRAHDRVHHDMQAMATDAQVAGTAITNTMQRTAGRSRQFLSLLGGTLRGIGKTGFAGFGAMTAIGFATQSAMGSLVTMGLMSEESSQKLAKFLEIFTLIGTVGSVVAPLMDLFGSLFGALGAAAGLVFNPITLSIAAVVGGVMLLNIALKQLLGIDLIGPIQQKLQQPFQGAIHFIEDAWTSFVDRFGDRLTPIIQPALDVGQSLSNIWGKAAQIAQLSVERIKLAWIGFAEWFKTLPIVKTAIDFGNQLIGALNHNPTERIPEAWDEAVEKITGFLQGLLKVGLTVGAALVGAMAMQRLKRHGTLLTGPTTTPITPQRDARRRRFTNASNKVEKFALYANAAHDIAELAGVQMPSFVDPLLKITTIVGVLGDLGSEVIPGVVGAVGGLGLSFGAVLGIMAGIGVAVGGLYLVWTNNLFGIQEKTGQAVAQIQLAWTGFSEWFKTLPIVQTAIDFGNRLIGALNCNPTEKIPEAWQGAVGKIIGFLGGLPIIGEFIGGKLTQIFNPQGIFGGLIEWASGLLNNPALSKFGGVLGKNFAGVQQFLQSLLGMNKKVEQSTATAGDAIGENYAETFTTAQKLAMAAGDQMASQYLKDVGVATDTTLNAPQVEALKSGALKLDAAPNPLKNPLEGIAELPTDEGELKQLLALQNAYDAQEKRNAAKESLSAPNLEAGAAGDAGKYIQQALSLQEARARSDRQMAAAMLGFQALTGKGSWEDAANYGKMARADFMGSDLGKTIATAKDKAVQIADEFSTGFSDRMDYLTHTGGGDVAALFAPGLDAAKQGGQALIGDFGHFAQVAGSALLKLDFAGVGKAATEFGSNAATAIGQIASGFQGASLSAIAFGAFSLLSLSPVTLTVGAIALGALAIATNFLGLRTIFMGLIKVATGLVQTVFAIGKAIFNFGRATRQILTGIFTLDFSLVKQGALAAWDTIKVAAQELKIALSNIFGGLWGVIRGIFQGIGQILTAPFRGVKGVIAGIRNAFTRTGQAIEAALTQPKQAWQAFLSLIERIRQRVVGVMDAISSSSVGQAVKKLTGRERKKETTEVTPATPKGEPLTPPEPKKGFMGLGSVFGKKNEPPVVPVAPELDAPAVEPAPKKKFLGGLFGKKEPTPVPVVPEVTPTPIEPTPKKKFLGGLFAKKEPVVVPAVPEPVSQAMDAAKSSPLGRSARAFSKLGQGAATSLDEARSAVDFEERLKGKEPGLTLSDRASLVRQKTVGRLSRRGKAAPPPPPPKRAETSIQTLGAANGAISSLASTLSMVAPAAAGPLFAVSGLADTFVSVSDALPDVKSGLTRLFPQLKGLSGAAKGAIAPIGKSLKGAIAPIGSAIGTAIAPLGPMIMGALAPLAPFALPILAGIAAGSFLLHQAFKNNFLGISTFVGNVVNGFKQFFGMLAGGAWDAVASVFITIEEQVKGIWSALSSVGSSLMEPFQPLLKLFGVGGGGGGLFGAAMKATVNTILLPLRVVTGTLNIVFKVLGALITGVIKVGGFLLNTWLLPLRLVMGAVGAIWNGVSSLVGGIIRAGQSVISFLLAPFRAAFSLLSKIPLIGGAIGQPTPVGSPGADTGADIPAYASGGFVPKTGLALLHEGEFVANPGVTGRNLEILERMHAGEDVPTGNIEVLPAIPAPVPVAPSTSYATPSGGGGGGGGTTVQINIENITVVSQGESSEELARDLFEELKPYLMQFFGQEGANNPHLVRFYRGAGKNALNHLR